MKEVIGRIPIGLKHAAVDALVGPFSQRLIRSGEKDDNKSRKIIGLLLQVPEAIYPLLLAASTLSKYGVHDAVEVTVGVYFMRFSLGWMNSINSRINEIMKRLDEEPTYLDGEPVPPSVENATPGEIAAYTEAVFRQGKRPSPPEERAKIA